MSDIAPTLFSFESPAFPDTTMVVTRCSVEEALTTPYSVGVDVTIQDLDAEPQRLVGADGVIRIRRGAHERRVCGVIVELEETRVEGRQPLARLRLAPALELLRHRRDTRIFQEKTVPEILEAVLGDALGAYGREAQLDLKDTYEPREYCLQYQETDLDFVQRLCEEEGIAYLFDHLGEVEVLRLTDKNASFEPVPTMPGDAVAPYLPHGMVVTDQEPVHRFEVTLRETVTAIALRDLDWTHAGHVVEADAPGEDPLGRTRESYEHGRGKQLTIGSYDQGVLRYQKNDAARQTTVRQQEAVATGRVARGVGRVIGMAPGYRFTMSGHPSVGVDGDWIVTRVLHLSVPAEARLDGDAEGAEPYHNLFEAIPLDVPYRPHRTVPKPRIDGVQTAIVTGPAGEEIHVDEHGRIKVQFYWDRENPADDTSSCWIRVKQEWAGAGWGFWWVPRIGMEVVVQFIDGDPDRPLVTGSVYNGANPTPYALPDEKTKSTIKSNSSLGGDGFNELRFEDRAGEEQIYTHAQKDYDEVVENDHNTRVHHDQTNTVDNDQRQTVDGNQVERVDVNQTMTVGANRTVVVGGDYDETVDGTETRTVTGDVKEDFAASETRTIGGAVTETIGGNEARDVGASLSETISASHTRSVGGSETLTITGSQVRNATGGITRTTPANEEVTVAGTWTVTAPAGIDITAPGGVTLVIPGGVSRADFKWETTATGWKTECGAIDIEIVLSKLGIAGTTTGVWGVKLDFHGSETKVVGSEMVMEKIKTKMHATARAKMAAIIGDTEAAKIL